MFRSASVLDSPCGAFGHFYIASSSRIATCIEELRIRRSGTCHMNLAEGISEGQGSRKRDGRCRPLKRRGERRQRNRVTSPVVRARRLRSSGFPISFERTEGSHGSNPMASSTQPQFQAQRYGSGVEHGDVGDGTGRVGVLESVRRARTDAKRGVFSRHTEDRACCTSRGFGKKRMGNFRVRMRSEKDEKRLDHEIDGPTIITECLYHEKDFLSARTKKW